MSTRDDIANAASTVMGVNVSSVYRQTLQPGQGFVRWAGRVQSDDQIGFMDRWQVWLALPQDLTAAEAWISERLDQLVEAIDQELVVTAITPAELALGTGPSVNGLIIDGSRPASD